MKFEKVSLQEWIRSGETEDTYDNIKLPKRGTKNSAGYDFYSPSDFIIPPGESELIPTGIKANIDADKVLMLFPRSSLGIKHSISLANTTGIIDADYYNNPDNEGHIFIKLINNNHYNTFECTTGDRLVQGIIIQYFVVSDDDTKSERSGGIGSTGN